MKHVILSRREVVLTGAVLPLAACAAWDERGGDTGDGYTLVDALPAALPIIESSEDMRAKVTRFRAEVLTPYAEPYGLLRPMDDTSITNELDYLAERVDAYRQLSVRFRLALVESWRRFGEIFPATMLEGAVVYLLPAPRWTVGGAVRPLGPDRAAVLFGSNQVIGSLASPVSISTLIHHELTHCCHIQSNAEIRQATASFFHRTPGPSVKLYQMMWLEGLAGYVSKTLNPSAPSADVLSDANLPANVAAHWTRVISGMLENWDSTDIDLIDAYVGSGDARNIPSRSAYYVGMLVAAHLAEHQSLPALTVLKGAELRDQLATATQAIMAAGPRA